MINGSVLALKQVWRMRLRTLLTVLGVATGMGLFTMIETVQQATDEATTQRANDQVLIVYRENRFARLAVDLPSYFEPQISDVPGVAAVIPMQVVVNNCNASLDVITFRGVPRQAYLDSFGDEISLLAGSFDQWLQRDDAVLVGDVLAKRRGLKIGDQFASSGVTAVVAGIMRSDRVQDRDVAFIHLPYLQQIAAGGLGEVTQFTVEVQPGSDLQAVSEAIDQRFANSESPTHTRPERAFIAQTAADILEWVRFTRWVGIAAVIAVCALVANTMMLAVRGRQAELAVFQVVGFRQWMLLYLVAVEGVVLGLGGGAVGILAATLILSQGGFAMANEGLSIVLQPTWMVVRAQFDRRFGAWSGCRLTASISCPLG